MKQLFFLFTVIYTLSACQKADISANTTDLILYDEKRSCGLGVVYKYGKYKQDSVLFEIRNYAQFLDTSQVHKLVTKMLGTTDAPVVTITNYSNYLPFSLCPGIIPLDYNPIPKDTWVSVSGKISLKIKEELPVMMPLPMYKAYFLLEDVILKNEKGEIIQIDNLLLDDTIIGGPLPG